MTDDNNQLLTLTGIAKEICDYLQLENSGELKKQIVTDLLVDGRHKLFEYEEHLQQLVPKVLACEKTYSPGQSETPLLQLLKQHVEDEWINMVDIEPRIKQFLEKMKTSKCTHYDDVLRRVADYGTKYTKSSSLLSIVLQLLLDIDDEILRTEHVFGDVWKTVVAKGLRSTEPFTKFRDYISSNDLDQQMKSDSALSVALRIYYSNELSKIIRDMNIPDKETLANSAADEIMSKGWKLGIKSIEPIVTGRQYKSIEQSISAKFDLSNELVLSDNQLMNTTTSSKSFRFQRNFFQTSLNNAYICRVIPSRSSRLLSYLWLQGSEWDGTDKNSFHVTTRLAKNLLSLASAFRSFLFYNLSLTLPVPLRLVYFTFNFPH